MGRPLIASPEVSDAAVVTASSEAGVFSAANLLDKQPYRVWRSAGLTESLVVDLGAAVAVRLVWIGYTNATSSATWRVRAADTEAGLTSAPSLDSGVVSHWPDPNLGGWNRTHAFLWLGSPSAYRWWRIDVDDSSNPAGYYQAGRLYIARGWRPSRGARFGWNHGFIDGSKHRRNENSNLFVTPHRPLRQFDLTLSYLSETEMYEQAIPLDRDRGSSGDVLYIHDPENSARLMDWSIQAVMTQLRPISNIVLELYEKRFRFEEWESP